MERASLHRPGSSRADDYQPPGGHAGYGTRFFVRPDDPTNSVEHATRMEVTSTGLGSFCLTDARLEVFHQAGAFDLTCLNNHCLVMLNPQEVGPQFFRLRRRDPSNG